LGAVEAPELSVEVVRELSDLLKPNLYAKHR